MENETSPFFSPLLVAFLVYYGSNWRPLRHTNHGTLIQPPRTLPRVALPQNDAANTASSWVCLLRSSANPCFTAASFPSHNPASPRAAALARICPACASGALAWPACSKARWMVAAA